MNQMNKIHGSFLVFLLIFVFDGCNCKSSRYKRYPTKRSSIHFTLDGQHFQMQLLNLSGIQDFMFFPTTEGPTVADVVIAKSGTEAIDQIAQLNIIEKATESYPTTVKFVGNMEETVKTLKKMKDLYKEFGSLLKAHENDLLSLMKNQENSNDPVKYQRKSKDQSGEETAININIHSADANRNIESQKYAYNEHFGPGKHKNVDADNLNIHLHADPPMKMRTIIGYPRKAGKAKIHPLKKDITSLRLFARETVNPTVVPDLMEYEPNTQDTSNQGHISQEDAFLRRGSELLLNMWKRFQDNKLQNKPDDAETQNFNEEFESVNYNG